MDRFHLQLHWRHGLMALAVAMAVAAFVAIAPTAGATPTTVFGPPSQVSKVTLGDVSIDGPAMWTSATGTVRLQLAWVGGGNDTAHHLNVMSSTDGVHWFGKVTLRETSSFRPGLLRYGPGTTDNVVLAWTGTDRNRSLNVLDGLPNNGYTKLTLWNDNSFVSPSIAMTTPGDLYLVWAGTDGSHTLNVAHIIARGGMYMDWKKTLWGWTSISRPTAVFDPNTKQLLMSWTGADNRIHFASSADGKSWAEPATSAMAEWTDVGPHMFSTDTNNMPRYWVTWRGSGADTAHHINVMYTEGFPHWVLVGNKTTLSETAFGGPVIGYIGSFRHVVVAWAGTDTLHHLNIAVIAV